MNVIVAEKTDKDTYNKIYKEKKMLANVSSKEAFCNSYNKELTPFFKGGIAKGYARGLAIKQLLESADATGKNYKDITVLDAGCGLGGLSCYLALNGFNVIGIDISKEACKKCENLSEILEVSDHCTFYPTSLESIPLNSSSVDFIIGHASLHHFIKYEEVPRELYRVLKNGGKGFFVDSFNENKLYRVFHNKKEMKRKGDVLLTKNNVTTYLEDFNTIIIPIDWFVMLDKLYLKIFPRSIKPILRILRKISKLHFWLDRKISVKSRIALYFSGTILTVIKKQNN